MTDTFDNDRGLMGCAPSGSADGRSASVGGRSQELMEWLEGLLSNEEPHNVLAAYIEIEKSISKEESQSPASTLGFALSRQHLIKSLMDSATAERSRHGALIPQENSIYELFLDLRLYRSPNIAAEHEEFIASVNRRALNLNLSTILEKRLAATEEAIRVASLRVNRLQILYERQDLLLGRIYGETHGSDREKTLEEEVDTLRNYRDAFSNGTSQWEDSARNAQEAAELLRVSVASWRSIQSIQQLEKKLSAAAEARNGIQEATLLIQISQDSMPGVQFPYCTKRELTSISQAIEYVFTDILIEDRYSHAGQVYKNYQERAETLSNWIKQVLISTLKKDLMDIDRAISNVSASLRDERINVICEKLGIENNYSRFGLNPAVNNIRPAIADKLDVRYPLPEEEDGYDRRGYLAPYQTDYLQENFRYGLNTIGKTLEEHDLHAEFRRKLSARRKAMWPSRRIEELRTFALGGSEAS